MKIGILQTGHAAAELAKTFGDYPDMFMDLLSGRGFSFEVYAVVDGVFPKSVDECQGWLITGSEHGVYEQHPWIPALEAFVRTCHETGAPLAGICFGHQIMAQALGGKVEKFSGGWAIGRTIYEFDGIGPVALNASHQDQVVTCPPEAKTIARNDFCAYAALSYGGKAISVQAHPEFRDDYSRASIKRRAGRIIPAAQAEIALKSFGPPNDSPLIATLLSDFFKQAARSDAA